MIFTLFRYFFESKIEQKFCKAKKRKKLEKKGASPHSAAECVDPWGEGFIGWGVPSMHKISSLAFEECFLFSF